MYALHIFIFICPRNGPLFYEGVRVPLTPPISPPKKCRKTSSKVSLIKIINLCTPPIS